MKTIQSNKLDNQTYRKLIKKTFISILALTGGIIVFAILNKSKNKKINNNNRSFRNC